LTTSSASVAANRTQQPLRKFLATVLCIASKDSIPNPDAFIIKLRTGAVAQYGAMVLAMDGHALGCDASGDLQSDG
jgi:hypothetical protein